MIAYIDKPPRIDVRGEGFLVTFSSGEQPIQLLLTRHALFGLHRVVKCAEAKATIAELDREPPIKFGKRRRECSPTRK